MTDKIFIDTNILIYANDTRERDKQAKAIAVISALLKEGRGVVSTQVLQEYACVALRKLGQRPEVVIRQLRLLERLEIIRQSPGMIRRAVEISQTYRIGFWDACIVANAENADCAVIYSEDLNTGQFYSGLRVENPLATSI